MSRIKILENDREIPLNSAFYLKTSGSFNYFLTLEIRGNPRSTGSSLMIFAYSKPDRRNIIATQFAYRRIKNSQTETINNKSNCFRCGVKDIQSYIEVVLRPIEEDYQGEIKLVYGPIELDNLTKDKYTRAKGEINFQIECHGKADNKGEFTLLCFDKDFIVAKDSNLHEIKRMKIVPEMMVVSNSVYPEKLKILLPALSSEMAVEFDQVRDKDVALLLIEHKKKLVIEGKSNLLRNPGLPDHFRIEKKSNNHLDLGQGMGENSINETFRDNLHSLTDLLKETKKENPEKNQQNNNRINQINNGNRQMKNRNNQMNNNNRNINNNNNRNMNNNRNSNRNMNSNRKINNNNRNMNNNNRNNQNNLNVPPNNRGTRVVIKQVDSRDEIREVKENNPRNAPHNRPERSSDNIITFDPNAQLKKDYEMHEQNRQRQEAKNSNYKDPLVLKNPYHSNAKKRYLFKTKQDNNILDSISKRENPTQRKNNNVDDISDELLNFEGMSENEMDKMINNVFKKEKVDVQRYGQTMKDSLDDVYKAKPRRGNRESDSFFNDVNLTKDYHEVPVMNFKKKQGMNHNNQVNLG